MNDVISFLRNYDYDICLAKGKEWAVTEAVDYLAAYLTNKESWYASEDAQKAFPYIRYQVFSAARQSIEAGHLLISEEYGGESVDGTGTGDGVIDFNRSTVNPFVFISWAIDNNIKVPKQFARYVAQGKRDKYAHYEGLGVKAVVLHHERCRAVAELLWSINPEMEIAKMAQCSEIVSIGCEGRHYDTRTICRWLANLKEDRRPGRRKNS